MITVYKANTSIDANIAQDILEMQGIKSHIMGALLEGGVGELQPSGLVTLMVEDNDYPRASEIIYLWQKELL
jgi:hypothetical protein